MTWGRFFFILGLILVLLGQIPWLAIRAPLLAELRQQLLAVPVAAAFRGVLLGLGLGAVLAVLVRLRPGARS